MTTSNFTCPNCGSTVEQSRCQGCRRKIHSYKCPKCGADVPNPEYKRP
ncbi:MAG: zinc finger domain-containing protein [Candidatus Bathyarchaeota archaeon]|nr:zinc finger domain-containing protein [Candidatus Bathyarchaeota archaeon]